MALETGSRKHLKAVLQSYHSFTTDMGTELNISTLSSSLDDLLPPWWRPEEDAVMHDGEVSDDENGSTVEPLLQQCIPIPGILLDQSLGHFSDWYSTMKVFSALLCNSGRRRALYSGCVAGTPYQCLEIMSDHLSGAIPQPYEKRWGCIHDFLTDALPVLQVLRQAWNENKYVVEAGADVHVTEFDPKAMTSGLKDGFSGLLCLSGGACKRVKVPLSIVELFWISTPQTVHFAALLCGMRSCFKLIGCGPHFSFALNLRLVEGLLLCLPICRTTSGLHTLRCCLSCMAWQQH